MSWVGTNSSLSLFVIPMQNARSQGFSIFLITISFMMFLSSEILTSASALSSSSSPAILSLNLNHSFSRWLPSTAATPKIHCCRVFQEVPVAVPEFKPKSNGCPPLTRKVDSVPNAVGGNGGSGISGIHVPRQRCISVSKSGLLKAILLMFESQEEIDQFILLSSCLDSILHAEHKSILEEMRVDYDLTHSMENRGINQYYLASSGRKSVCDTKESDSALKKIGGMENYGDDKIDPDKPIPTDSASDLTSLLGSSPKNIEGNSFEGNRVTVATRFQRAFVQLLYNAQFEELSARDLMLTSTLNTDYLLTLPVYVDWKKASESNVIIYRRGYATERQKGLLIVDKLDYVQSKLLQGIFFMISKPLGKFGTWFTQALKSTIQGQDAQIWTNRIKQWLKEMPLLQQSYSYYENLADNTLGVDNLADSDLPIWLAAQRAVTRYEGTLSPVGPRGRLLTKLLSWIGLVPPTPKKPFDLDSDISAPEPYLRPIFLSRISLGDIWEPATRKFCGNDLWKMLKTAISILLSQSILQEAAFQELILLYSKETGERETEDKAEVPSLQLKIYERIPIPDLPVIFPHKKLSFRILDTVRLDIATILGLLAYFINYKFEDIRSSPSAILLDVIAITGLIIYLTRVALGYKQTWDRYQLLVNRTLNEKTIASGFGSVHFLLDASEQQQYKEAILAYAILLKADDDQVTCARSVGDKCERFMYNVFKLKVEMPVDKAMDTLVRLGLVTKQDLGQTIGLHVVSCPKAYEILKQRWNKFL